MKTQFITINQSSPDLAKMQAFARSFDHVIDPKANSKLIAFHRGDVVFGYADVIYLPIAFPAFHPGLTKPRAVVEVMQGYRAHCQFSNGGEGLIGVPLAEDAGRTNFPHDIIAGQGLSRMKRELYSL